MKYICSCYIIIVIFLFPGSNCLAFDKPGPFFPDISVFLFAKFLNDKNIFSKKQTQLSQRIEENLFSIPDIKLLPAWRKSLILYVCVPPTPPRHPPPDFPGISRSRRGCLFNLSPTLFFTNQNFIKIFTNFFCPCTNNFFCYRCIIIIST